MDVEGINFKEAWKNRKKILFGKTPIYVIGFDDLIQAKKAMGRAQDMLDIQKLREHPRVDSVNVETREQTQVLQIQAPAGHELVQEFLRLLDGVRVSKVVTRQPTLEDAYVKLVGKEAMQI